MKKQYFLHLVVKAEEGGGVVLRVFQSRDFLSFYTDKGVQFKTSKLLTEPSFDGNKLVKFDDLPFYKLLTLFTKCIYKTLFCTETIS